MGREWMRRYEHLCPFFPPGKSTFSRKWPMSLLLIDIVMRSRCVYRSLWLIPPERNGAYSFPAHPYSWIFFPFVCFVQMLCYWWRWCCHLKFLGLVSADFWLLIFMMFHQILFVEFLQGVYHDCHLVVVSVLQNLTPLIYFLSFIYLRNSICSNYSILN